MADPETEELNSDDEAPEQVTFQQSRQDAAENLKRATQALQREKALLKEKRRRREELFKEQKKRKLLPTAVLEEVASLPQKRLIETAKAQDEGKDAETAKDQEDNSKDEGSEEDTTDDRVKKNYTAVRLKDQDQSSLQQQTAKDFIQNRLYGPGSKRTTVNQFFSMANKKGALKKPAVRFINNAWGAEKKRKAKHFKSRWVHKQGIPT
ncbi:hypothetical protein NDU88_004777 [Pleurodeles waltl]|uniref:U3 small nucleolar RNA-associated protein NOL7 C-terminal domain-containing protein n=1 Tax=Pleurodeles waltl TaxID=8319 RepID=A0AAV7VH70_PLEWA|nr:hypothetical protein NDU88_004777 [Pleurodeles waltl]